MIRLICGYTRSGKDTFARYLNTTEGKKSFSWAIYYHPQLTTTTFTEEPGYRLAFADEVKKQVLAELNLPLNYNIEKKKNEVIPGTEKTFRSFCIDKGCGERKKDKCYWVKLAFDKLKPTQEGIPTITDWRFKEELTYAQNIGEVITIRVYRKDVPIPEVVNPDDDPEHTLDETSTDYLIVPAKDHEEEFKSAQEVFPQYKGYILYKKLEMS